MWFVFDAPPANGATADGFFDRAEQNDVHQLAIIETLEKHRNEERPVLMAFEGKRNDAGEDVDDNESKEKDHRALDVGGGPELRNLRDMKLRQTPQQQAAQEQQIDDGGNQR